MNYSKAIFILLQEHRELKVRVYWADTPVPQPVMVVRGSLQQPNDVYLAADKVLILKIEINHIPVALMAAFYFFNVQYTPGLANFFAFMETYFLGIKPPKLTTISNFLAQLNSYIV